MKKAFKFYFSKDCDFLFANSKYFITFMNVYITNSIILILVFFAWLIFLNLLSTIIFITGLLFFIIETIINDLIMDKYNYLIKNGISNELLFSLIYQHDIQNKIKNMEKVAKSLFNTDSSNFDSNTFFSKEQLDIIKNFCDN